MNEIIGQALSIIATIVTFISYQANTKKRLLLIQTTATLCTCLSFLFLGASTGFVLNIVCIIRNVAFFFQKDKSTVHTVTAILLALTMIVLGIFSWQGPVSLLIIIALAANTLFMATGNPQILRKSVIATSSMILIYDAIVFSIGGMTNEGISIISSIIGIIRFRKEKTAEGLKNELAS
jgi:hypothetical protein